MPEDSVTLVTSASDNAVALEAAVVLGVQGELGVNPLMGVVLSIVLLPSLIIRTSGDDLASGPLV